MNLEVDRYPHREYVLDPKKGPPFLKPRRWTGEFRNHFPPTIERLNEELGLLWRLKKWATRRSAAGATVRSRVLRLAWTAIALNRAIWRDATLAGFVQPGDAGLVGEYIRELRRKGGGGKATGLKVRWGESSATHFGSRLPNPDEAVEVLLGRTLPHVIESEQIVVDLGVVRIYSWAVCTNDSAHGGACICKYCMHTVDPATVTSPDLEKRLVDPAVRIGATLSHATGWGPSGPLRHLKQSLPDASAREVHLSGLFGRTEFVAGVRSYRRWVALRQSGKRVGRPKARLDESTATFVEQRLADGISMRRVYAEVVSRPGARQIAWTTFHRRYKGSRPRAGSKPQFPRLSTK